jgi:hypothetical protein
VQRGGVQGVEEEAGVTSRCRFIAATRQAAQNRRLLRSPSGPSATSLTRPSRRALMLWGLREGPARKGVLGPPGGRGGGV